MRRGALVRWVAALALVAATTWSASAIGDPFHSAPGDPFQVGKQPKSVAIGDLNGDQRPDLAVANLGSDDVSVLLGTATGRFVPAAGSPLKVGEAPSSVAIGDLNGDQHPDLAVANLGSDDVSVLLGTATGTFVPAAGSPLKVGDAPASVVIGDLNGDQHPDLAVANLGSDDVRVLLGTGTGAFARAPGLPLKTGNRPISVVIGDLNGDQRSDLAVANLDSDDVTVLLSGVRCVVPRLTHKRLGPAQRLLVRADCSLGSVTKPHRRGGRGRLVVVAQTPRAGRVVRAGSAVAVRLAPRTRVRARRETPLRRQVATCLTRAGATIVRRSADLDFAKGTSLYGAAPAAGTDVVAVDGNRNRATVSFMPDEGTWRIYTLSVLGRGIMNPNYKAIWAQIFDDPAALEVVAYVKGPARRSAAQQCMNFGINFGGPEPIGEP